MKEYVIETKKLTKVYKGQTVVDQLDLAISEKKVYGLLGPNGAGKSTTLKLMMGIVRPTDGEIYYKGETWQRKHLDQMGALIERPPLYANLTAQENLLVRTTVLGLDKERINEVLEQVGLTKTHAKRAGQFSLGMKQRLGIAMALINQPRILILDEPTNGLDPMGIQDLRQLIRSLPEQGISVILSSHILSEVERTADEIGIISQGRLGYQGGVPDSTAALEQLFMEIVQSHEQGGIA